MHVFHKNKKGVLFDGVIFTLLNFSGETHKRIAKYTKQKLSELKREINKSIMMVEVFNTPPSVIELIDRKSARTSKSYIINSTNRIELNSIHIFSSLKSRKHIF